MRSRETRFIGCSVYASRVRDLIALIGPEPCNVIVQGPTGSGKRIVVQALFETYGRGQLIRVPAVQLDGDVLRSDLFGHRKASFTGATQDRAGLLISAEGGVLVVDEADQPPATAQAYLLDIAEGEQLWPFGSDRPFQASVRVIVCVHDSPENLVASGKWRSDMCYRLDQERIVLEPLVTHLEDIAEIVAHLVERMRVHRGRDLTLGRGLVQHLSAHNWPGNVRELDSVLQRGYRRAVREQHSDHVTIEIHHLELGVARSTAGGRGGRLTIEIDEILGVLSQSNGSVARAAKAFGISTQTIWRRLKEHGIDPTPYRDRTNREVGALQLAQTKSQASG